MSCLDDYNKKTQAHNEWLQRFHGIHPLYTSSYNPETQKWDLITAGELEKRQLVTFKEIEKYFLSDECDWIDMPSYHSDLKFVNCLKRYCKTLKDNKVAPNDRTALELIAESRVAIDRKTESDIWRLIRTSWTERELSNEHAGKLFRIMADRLLQDVFVKPIRGINVVNFSELDSPDNNSNLSYRLPVGASSSFISSVGKRKCRQCGKPAIDTDVCYEHNSK